MRAVLFAAILVTGCQLMLVFESDREATPDARDGETPDASDDAASEVAREDASRCDPSAPFGEPVPFALNTSDDESSLWLSEDEKTGYLTRASSFLRLVNDNRLVAGTELDVDVDGYKGRPSVFRDRLYFHAYLSFNLKLYSTQLEGGTALPATPLPFPGNDEGEDADPWVTPRETLFFASTRGGAGYRIYAINLLLGGEPASVPVLNAPGDVTSPIVVSDELTIYVGSSVSGDFDIYRATRPSRGVPFGEPIPEPLRINRAKIPEWPRWVSEDDCVMYFGRGAQPTTDLYRVERPRR